MAPEVAVIVTVLCAGAVGVGEMVKIDVTFPAVGVTVGTLNVQDAPDGHVLRTLSDTVALNPAIGVTVMVELVFAPALTGEGLRGDASRLNPCAAAC
jgi:hypothetical protein